MAQMPEWPKTPWSKILKLQEESPGQAREALQQILTLYYDPIRQYMARHASPQNAEDWAHEFAAKMMEKNLPGRVQVGHHFRNYLAAAMRNYVLDQYRKQKRDPLKTSADAEVLERIASAERQFHKEWGTLLIRRAITRLEERTAADPQHVPSAADLRLLRLKYGLTDDGRARSYQEMGRELGQDLATHTIDNALRRTKKALLATLREEVQLLTADEDHVDEELWELSRFL